MKNFRDQWTFAMAMEVLQSSTVDSNTWSDAVKWLLLYGPADVRTRIQEASGIATHACFPELKCVGFSEDGSPCFSLEELAEALDMSMEEAGELIASIEKETGVRQFLDPGEVKKLQ